MARRADYFFRETFQGLKRNGLVAFAAVSTVFIALFLLGGALLVQSEVHHLSDQAESDVQVSVFLDKDISPDQQTHIQELIQKMPEVATLRYESQEEAYRRFLQEFADQKALVQGASKDSLPASFRVKLKDPHKFAVVAVRLQGQPGIENIVDSANLYRRLFAVTRVFKIAGWAAAFVLGIAAAALIGNTVRMAVFARRKEIGIMRLVGATNWFIRIPFLIEGVVEGLLGAGAAVLGLLIMKWTFIDPLRGRVGFLPLPRMHDIVVAVPILLIASLVVSVASSIFATRRFLEV
jgi:cell division transport system permease protein